MNIYLLLYTLSILVTPAIWWMSVGYQLFLFFKQEQEKTTIVEFLLQVKDEQEARLASWS